MDWEERLEAWRQELALFDQLAGWVPLAEACETTGASRSAVRSWYRSGQIRSRLVDGPHGPQRLVVLDEVAARAEQSPRIRRRAEETISLEAQVELLRQQVRALELRLSILEGPSSTARS